MENRLEGVVRELLPIQEGEGRNGRWRKQLFILETAGGNYPRQVCIMAWGDKIDQFNLKEGDSITVSVDIESREYNGRWYTDIKAWKVERKSAATEEVTATEPHENHYQVSTDLTATDDGTDPFAPSREDDDLPF